MVWLDGVRDLTTDWPFHHACWRIAVQYTSSPVSQSLTQRFSIARLKLFVQRHKPIIFPPRHPALSPSLGIHRAELPHPHPQRIAWELE